VLVTGADGFVGRWTAAALLEAGHEVLGGVRGAPLLSPEWQSRLERVRWIPFVMADRTSVDRALATAPDAVAHLAAVASGAQARANPAEAWEVNTLGTCELLYAMERRGTPARLLFASTGEVYGRVSAERPITEADPVQPCSPYAASKAAAEEALLESHRRRGADVVIARAFAQTGAGQRDSFVVPALARRILDAQRRGAGEIPVGNLDPVREFVDVRDVAGALVLLLERAEGGGIYNVAAGRGVRLRDVFGRLAELIGWQGVARPDPALFRAADIPYLVGNGARLEALGWRPKYDLTETLAGVVAELRSEATAPAGAIPQRLA
jgi:GDP-4-dehydro-6-deoxy-D-mannose reductase